MGQLLRRGYEVPMFLLRLIWAVVRGLGGMLRFYHRTAA